MLYGLMETSDVVRLPEGWNAFLVKVTWSNPYTEPPEGWPRLLAEAVMRVPPGRGCPTAPADLQELVKQLGCGSGWTLMYASIPRPIKAWAPERRFAYRRSRLARRIRKKYPMFAEQMIGEVLAAKPDYYGLTKAGLSATTPLPSEE